MLPTRVIQRVHSATGAKPRLLRPQHRPYTREWQAVEAQRLALTGYHDIDRIRCELQYRRRYARSCDRGRQNQLRRLFPKKLPHCPRGQLVEPRRIDLAVDREDADRSFTIVGEQRVQFLQRPGLSFLGDQPKSAYWILFSRCKLLKPKYRVSEDDLWRKL